MVETNRRAATSSNGDTLAVFTYIFGAALIAVIAFVFFNNLLLPATVGALAGAIICVALASTYTLKSLEFWPDNSTITIINLLVALAASVAMFIGAEQTERDGFTLGRHHRFLRPRCPSAKDSPVSPPPSPIASSSSSANSGSWASSS